VTDPDARNAFRGLNLGNPLLVAAFRSALLIRG